MDHSSHEPDPAESIDHSLHQPEPAEPMEHGGMHEMQSDVTRPQLVAATVLSLLALAAGLLYSLNFANLRIGADDVDGAIMPPGMIMTRDMPAEAMKDMAAVDPGDVDFTAPADAVGDQTLEPRMCEIEGDGHAGDAIGREPFG